jgi:hypothetical protein
VDAGYLGKVSDHERGVRATSSPLLATVLLLLLLLILVVVVEVAPARHKA